MTLAILTGLQIFLWIIIAEMVKVIMQRKK